MSHVSLCYNTLLRVTSRIKPLRCVYNVDRVIVSGLNFDFDTLSRDDMVILLQVDKTSTQVLVLNLTSSCHIMYESHVSYQTRVV